MLGEKLKYYRENRGYTQVGLSGRTKIDASYISRIERGEIKSPSYEILLKLARALNVTLNDLTGQGVITQAETPEQILEKLRLAQPVSIPVYTDFPVHAGSGVEAVDYIYRTRPKPARPGIEGYIVHGTCLEPVVNDKDIIIVDREASIDNGDIVACLINGELRIARLRKVAEELWLENNHGKFRLEDCQVTAPVIEVIRRLK